MLSRAADSHLAPSPFRSAGLCPTWSVTLGLSLERGYETVTYTLTEVWGTGSRFGINALLAIDG